MVREDIENLVHVEEGYELFILVAFVPTSHTHALALPSPTKKIDGPMDRYQLSLSNQLQVLRETLVVSPNGTIKELARVLFPQVEEHLRSDSPKCVIDLYADVAFHRVST